MTKNIQTKVQFKSQPLFLLIDQKLNLNGELTKKSVSIYQYTLNCLAYLMLFIQIVMCGLMGMLY